VESQNRVAANDLGERVRVRGFFSHAA